MANRPQLRQRLFDDQQLGEHARDIQDALDALDRTERKTVEAAYQEPMTLALNEQPVAIEAIRVIDLSAQGTPVTCGSLCSFVWGTSGARITSIDGMSTVLHGGKRYRFTFRISYE